MRNTFKYILTVVSALAVSFSAFADGDTDSGIYATKTAKNNYNGTYTLELETFVKGQNVTVHREKPVPVDAVLVLDVSGSMDETMSSTITYDGTTDYTLDNFYSASTNTTYYLEQNGNYTFTVNATAWTNDGDATTTETNTQRTQTQNQKRTYTGTATIDGVPYEIVYTETRVGTRTSTKRNSGTWRNWSNWSYSETTGSVTKNEVSAHVSDSNLYLSQTTDSTVKRIDALKTACKTFVKNMYDNANAWNSVHPDEPVEHRISIVKFSGYSVSSETVLTLAAGNVADTSSIYSIIDALTANGATYAHEGLQRAKTQIQSARDSASKVVLFFTDGTPGANGWTDSYYGRYTTGCYVAGKSIGLAKDIKDAGAKFYSVTVLNLSVTDDEYKYLTLLSSAYPNATGSASSYTSTSSTSYAWRNEYPANPDREEEAKYYSQATNADALKAVFDKISSDISSETVPDLDETTEMRDIISEDFVLPVGAESDNITVYTQDCTFTDGTEFKFESPRVALDTATVAWNTNTAGQQVVNVSNFNFKEHWCGMDNDQQHLGKKLIIQIVIAQNPDSEGGIVTTNGEGSGIYVDGSRVEPYKVKPAVVLADRALVVKKTNMEPGETAIISVTDQRSGKVWKVAITADGHGNAEGEIKVPVVYLENNVETFCQYTIAEDNFWAWNYENTTAFADQTLYSNITRDDEGNITSATENFEFDFTADNNTKNSVLHGSAARENSFEYNGPTPTESEN